MKANRVLTGERLTASFHRDTNRQLQRVHAKLPTYRKLRRFMGNGLRYCQLAGSSAFRFYSVPFHLVSHPNNPTSYLNFSAETGSICANPVPD